MPESREDREDLPTLLTDFERDPAQPSRQRYLAEPPQRLRQPDVR